MEMSVNFKAAYEAILAANKILLVGHVNPDGDDLASVCLMMELLQSQNKKYLAYCEGKIPGPWWSFLPQAEEIIGAKSELQVQAQELDSGETNWFETFDLVIVLDCGSINRTNLSAEIRARRQVKVIEFDHHPKVDDYADIELRQPEKASTTEVLYNFLHANSLLITKNMATCILTGILTDTYNFLFPNASQETIIIASEMLSLGVNFNKIISETLSNKNILTIKLLSRALDNLRLNEERQIAISVLRPSDFDEIGRDVAPEAFDDIAAVLGNLAEVKAVLFMREYEVGKIKGSWRSRPDGYDVSEFAKTLGGGGHKHASGFQLSGHIVETGEGWKVETL